MDRRWNDVSWSAMLVVAAVATGRVAGTAGSILGVLALVGSYFAGRRMASLKLALIGFGAGAAVNLVLAILGSPSSAFSLWFTTVLMQFFICVLPWWWGRYRRLRAERSTHERHLIAEHARLRERARIAEDMHDQLGHDLALIALGSSALQVAEGATAQQRQAAAAVRTQAAAAIERLHDIVSVLREDGSPTALQPADESIEQLIERTRHSGATIALERMPPPPGAPAPSPLARHAVYRVVQESLTNAAKYAPGSAVDVSYDESSDPLRVVVHNSPAAPGTDMGARHDGRPGQGLTGLDERMSVLGGSFEAGPSAGGFAVTAVVPRDATVDGMSASEGPAPAPSQQPSPVSADADTVGQTQDLRDARRRSRARQLRGAVLPLALAAVLLVALLVLQLVTVRTAALSPEDYAGIEVGQTRDRLSAVLPSGSMDGPTPVLGEPAVPADVDCEYFQARADVFDLGSDMFRLCFRDDVLVSKDSLTSKEGS